MSWIQENWIICLIAVLVIIALIWWMSSRKKSDGPGEAVMRPDTAPKKPLEAAKPDIVPAEPARFKTAEPVKTAAPAATPPPSPAPITAAPVPPPTPAHSAAASVAGSSRGKADNLQLLKGVGPKLAALLTGLGVSSFDQIAGWSEADIAGIDAQLGTFKGRITRDNWVDQAGYLARGDKSGFEAKYGVLGSEL